VSRAALLTLAALVTCVPAVRGQTSVYGVLGIGMLGDPFGVRARALGGGLGSLDPESALNPAAASGFRVLTASAATTTTWRSYDVAQAVAGGLKDTRFPFAIVGGPIPGQPIGFAVSFSTYADRTFDLTGSDTVTIRGESVSVEDHISSIGTIADVRAALAWTPTPAVRVGAAVHLISGSAHETIQRVFGDTVYAAVSQKQTPDYSGSGYSFGVIVTPTQFLRIGASARNDTRLQATDPLIPTADVELPWTLTAGFLFAPTPVVRWSATGVWQGWAVANQDVSAVAGRRAFDAWSIGSGLELGGAGLVTRLPVRIGAHYRTLPFSPTDEQPHETAFALGSGTSFASGRASLDFALERLMRDGGGASERAWALTFSLTVRP